MTYPRGKVPKALWPSHFHHPIVKGLFNGGCVARGIGSSFRASAHAHAREDDKFFGWVCYRAGWKIDLEMLGLHEVAHLIAGKGHTDAWRRAVLSLGGTLDPAPSLKSYQKRKRIPQERECSTCLGHGKIRDGDTGQRRNCLDCRGTGER